MRSVWAARRALRNIVCRVVRHSWGSWISFGWVSPEAGAIELRHCNRCYTSELRGQSFNE